MASSALIQQITQYLHSQLNPDEAIRPGNGARRSWASRPTSERQHGLVLYWLSSVEPKQGTWSYTKLNAYYVET